MRTLIAVLALCFAAPALAQTPICGTKADILKMFAKQYGEKPIAMGIAKNGTLMILLMSPAKTWTALNISPSGMACVVQYGSYIETTALGEAI